MVIPMNRFSFLRLIVFGFVGVTLARSADTAGARSRHADAVARAPLPAADDVPPVGD